LYNNSIVVDVQLVWM